MRIIYKYQFGIGEFNLELPIAHQIVHVESQDGKPTMWILMEPSQNPLYFNYAIVGTGDPIPDSYGYIRTFQQPPFVWHLFSVGQEGHDQR